ncbi:hypothetical protein [Aneurinibacillus aneurinilyticus]|jgi:chromosome segregation ATPase|uniref:Uncharacterized protein n=1 Tax=Aneurinibacillus aneurinilyticus ATCC 12856 TaxID=649747 RepID=U1Y8H4_ANEAE|nr:hypothetical protein [Aneurinibacillus aneurinilyticus]ERI08472.1 hypothetical protein HMPREF0083_03458 [Aneurinibacillus aneurinilyticus ATCC 12856]MCI1693985.1 hypothetical protein [Aneurinibacillus aneurinilyticus]MED0708238.1 hypothetical protein [Aneurinibacillus aneurinilyticus]MED0723738.1 hypothetical protein [Aneurinibacillus aneurinilyticus]MED0730581.1 hypothetical protein [Aneurinibacillus aneurinilyticus]
MAEKMDTILQMLEQMNQQMDKGFGEVNERIGKLESETAGNTERLERMEERMISMEGRMSAVEKTILSMDGRLSSVEETVASMDGRLSSVEAAVASIEGRMGTMEETIISVEGRLDRMEGDITIIKDAVVHNLTETRSHVKHFEKMQERQQRVIELLSLRAFEHEADIRDIRRMLNHQ